MILRTSLLPGLIEASNNNIKNGMNSFRIFEVGKFMKKEIILIFWHCGTISALILYGYKYNDEIHNNKFQEDLFDLKGVLILIFSFKLNKIQKR